MAGEKGPSLIWGGCRVRASSGVSGGKSPVRGVRGGGGLNGEMGKLGVLGVNTWAVGSIPFLGVLCLLMMMAFGSTDGIDSMGIESEWYPDWMVG